MQDLGRREAASDLVKKQAIRTGFRLCRTTGFGNPRRRRRYSCINCDADSHVYKDCTSPITSYGIIAFTRGFCEGSDVELRPGLALRKEPYRCLSHQMRPSAHVDGKSADGKSVDGKSEPHYLLVQRKDTMGYSDFIRGKYPENANETSLEIKRFLEEMTCNERRRLATENFVTLWDDLWMNHTSTHYIKEFIDAKERFDRLDMRKLLAATRCSWTETEWGFGKGRRTMYETVKEASKREFREETGFTENQYKLISDMPMEENFVGTNGIAYKHVYYLAEIYAHVRRPNMKIEQVCQGGEISNMAWFPLKQALSVIRPYDVAKKELLLRVDKFIKVRLGMSTSV